MNIHSICENVIISQQKVQKLLKYFMAMYMNLYNVIHSSATGDFQEITEQMC